MYRKAKLPRDLAGALECAPLEGVVDLAALISHRKAMVDWTENRSLPAAAGGAK